MNQDRIEEIRKDVQYGNFANREDVLEILAALDEAQKEKDEILTAYKEIVKLINDHHPVKLSYVSPLQSLRLLFNQLHDSKVEIAGLNGVIQDLQHKLEKARRLEKREADLSLKRSQLLRQANERMRKLEAENEELRIWLKSIKDGTFKPGPSVAASYALRGIRLRNLEGES